MNAPPRHQYRRNRQVRVMISAPRLLLLLLLVVGNLHGATAFSSSTPAATTRSDVTATSTTSSSSPQQQQEWKPIVASLDERRNLRGLQHHSETIGSLGFHHIEFYCGDAKSTALRFALALGMHISGTTGQSTGNDQCVSYGLVSENFRLLCTAPYSHVVSTTTTTTSTSTTSKTTVSETAPHPLPNFSPSHAHQFFQKHGLAVRALGIEVQNAKRAYEASIARGATSVLEPTWVPTCVGQQQQQVVGERVASSGCYMAEVELYGDVVLRYVSFPDGPSASTANPRLPFLPHLAPIGNIINNSNPQQQQRPTFGIYQIDHAVGNVHNLAHAYQRISTFTGFHEFAEFTTDDVGTVESGLNSIVLASDTEQILLPLNEPTLGKRKSQIQTFLEQNEGPGLQHLALKTRDIFETITKMREAERNLIGFELMIRPSDEYYRELPTLLGDRLSPEQYAKLEELGILADADDEGLLLQIFTKPIGDRPTFFIEIIQRIGCLYTPEGAESSDEKVERPGCGGFGRGNFRELFKSIEELEKTLKV